MSIRRGLVILVPLALMACSSEPKIAFQSEQERVCYERVEPTLPRDKSLRRDSAGTFVEVTIINSSVRDIGRNAAFDACMVNETDPGSITDLGTITFSGEEQVIWNSLSDAARRDALEYIKNGGTLREFVAI